jgi:DNA-binding beta-propeller fold protein YncE
MIPGAALATDPTKNHVGTAATAVHAEQSSTRLADKFQLLSSRAKRGICSPLYSSNKHVIVSGLDFMCNTERFKNLRRCSLRKLAIFTLLAAFAIPSAPAADSYAIIKKIPIPGQGSWDYLTVDEAARRLYVSHGTQVEVVDVDSGAIVGNIPNTQGVHGIAIAPELGRGFVSNGKSSTVTIFDLKTLKVTGETPTGKKPDAIIYDPATSRVFAFNGDSNSATAIEAADGKVAGTVDLGGGPEYAVADGKGYVYNNLEDESLVLKIDSRKLKVEQRWPTAPCASPSSIAMDRENRRLFIGCRSKVMAVMNADTGQVITTLPIGDHVDATIFDTDSRLIFNSNGEGTITVIHQDSPDKYSVVENVKTLPRAKTMALDPKTHQLFLSTAEAGQFEVLVVGK